MIWAVGIVVSEKRCLKNFDEWHCVRSGIQGGDMYLRNVLPLRTKGPRMQTSPWGSALLAKYLASTTY